MSEHGKLRMEHYKIPLVPAMNWLHGARQYGSGILSYNASTSTFTVNEKAPIEAEALMLV